jgi:ubiquitin carboxyl-terminal hydrolase 5/13
LQTLGIDVATQKKTEKTMQEIDLEMNLNLTLSKIVEEGKTLIPIYGPWNTGLENLGNSCYMNSVLQVIFAQPEF